MTYAGTPCSLACAARQVRRASKTGTQLLGQVDRRGLGLALASARRRLRGHRLLRLLAQRYLPLAPQHRAARLGQHQRPVLALDREQPLRQQLPYDTAPFALGQLLADAEHGQLVVVELDDLGGPAARAGCRRSGPRRTSGPARAAAAPPWTAPSGPRPCRPTSPGGTRQVSQFPHAVRLGVLAEVGEQLGSAALDGLAQREHRVEVRGGPALERLVALAGLDQLALLYDVVQAVRHPGRGRESVAARAARLLVVALDGLRQVEVGDEPYVRLVDAHAEGDGRARRPGRPRAGTATGAPRACPRPGPRGTAPPRCRCGTRNSAVFSTELRDRQ